jgi:hypothetical protein
VTWDRERASVNRETRLTLPIVVQMKGAAGFDSSVITDVQASRSTELSELFCLGTCWTNHTVRVREDSSAHLLR